MRDFEKYLLDFDSLPFESVQARYRKKNFVEVANDLSSVKKVIEVGCGESSVFEYQRFDHEAIIEPIPEFISRLGDRIQLRDFTIFDSSLEDCVIEDTYDLVIASCVLHEVADPSDFLKHLIKLVAGDGYLYLDVPNATSFHRHLAVETGFLENIYARTSTQDIMQQSSLAYDIDGLVNLVESRGLEVIKSGGYFLKPFHHHRMMSLVDSGLLSDKDLDGLYQMGKRYCDLASEIFVLCKLGEKTDD